jgi:hypothetical protein
MDSEKLLEVIQVQRHDFLNHLQVISGFLQLNKPERIREYIELIILEMRAMSQTARFKIPEITAALLVGFNEASKYQAKMELMVNSNLDHCMVAGPVVGEALESVLNCFFKNLASPELEERDFAVSFEESETEYNICLSSPASCIDDPVLLKKDLEPVKELLNRHGGCLNNVLLRENIEIFLCLPRKRAENGQTTG